MVEQVMQMKKELDFLKGVLDLLEADKANKECKMQEQTEFFV